MDNYADFKQRVIEKTPRLKAMSLKERSSESLVFGISATLEYHNDYTDFPSIIREIDKIKKHCGDDDSKVRQFLRSQEHNWFYHGGMTNYLYRGWRNACNNVTKVYSEWYKNNTAEIYATLQSKNSDKERIFQTIVIEPCCIGYDHGCIGNFFFIAIIELHKCFNFQVRDFEEGDRINFYYAIGGMVFSTTSSIDVVKQNFTYVCDKSEYSSLTDVDPAVDKIIGLPSLTFKVTPCKEEDDLSHTNYFTLIGTRNVSNKLAIRI